MVKNVATGLLALAVLAGAAGCTKTQDEAGHEAAPAEKAAAPAEQPAAAPAEPAPVAPAPQEEAPQT